MKKARDGNRRWMPYNQVIRLDLNDAQIIFKLGGVKLSKVGSGFIENHLEEAMVVADAIIARMVTQ